MADRNNNLGSSGRSDDSIDNPDLDRGESGGMRGSSSDRDRSETVGDEPDRSRDNDRSGSSGGQSGTERNRSRDSNTGSNTRGDGLSGSEGGSGYGGQSGQGGRASRR